MNKLVLIRHGQSTWNKKNLFTGWTDVPLTSLGKKEAKEAAKLMIKEGFKFDIIYTNMLKRAIDTTNIITKEMNLQKIQIIKAWQLNERHYGALQGFNKAKMAKKFGEKRVLLWRRSYDIRPPSLKKTDKRHKEIEHNYKKRGKLIIPMAESLLDTIHRVNPYWDKIILPKLKNEKKILISASGNSLRALVKIIDNISKKEIVKFNIPTGIPLVYELGGDYKPIRHYFLGDKKNLKNALNKVINQGKAK